MNNATILLTSIRVDDYLKRPSDAALQLVQWALTPPRRLSHREIDELESGWDYLAQPEGPSPERAYEGE